MRPFTTNLPVNPAPRESRPWRLVFPRALWNRALRGLHEFDGAWATGTFRLHETRAWREALVADLDVSQSPVQGHNRPPGQCWYSLRLRSPLTLESLNQVVGECQVRPSQAVIVLCLDPHPPCAWSAVMLARGMPRRVDEVRVTGPGPLCLTTISEDSERGVEPRWSRTAGVIGDSTLHWLRKATVTQVGAGRLGTLMAWQWASLGVRRLRICDADVLESHNLTDMPGLAETEIAQAKVVALAQSLRDFRHDLEISICEQTVQSGPAGEFLEERSDLLVTTVDDDLPRLVVSQAARRTLTPHLDVASHIVRQAESDTRQFRADARLLLPGLGCVRCVGGLQDEPQIYRRLSAPPTAIPWQFVPTWDEQRAGSLLGWNMQIAGAATDLWLDMISGQRSASYWHRMTRDSGGELRTEGAQVGPGEDCPLCLGRDE